MLHPRLTLALLGGFALYGIACAGSPPFEDEYQRQQTNEDGGSADGSQSGPNGNPSPVSNTNEDGGSNTSTGDDGGTGTTSTGDDGGSTGTGDDDGATGTVNGCTAADFAANDETGASAARTITVGASGQVVHERPLITPPTPTQYSPNCMTISAGQAVTWNVAFTSLPLGPSGGTTPTPITSVTAGTSVSFAFPSQGTYGFDNPNAPTVMFGAILVTP